jgi:uncharacterized sulfatase
MGFLMRGTKAVDAAREELRAALQDESPTVRIIAARALGQYGNEDDLALVLPVLKELAPADKNGAYASILDLNAIDALGKKAAPLLDTIKTMATKDPAAAGRADGYVGRLVKDLTGSDGEGAPAAKAKKRANRKKQ